jgi:hypothetical protein
MLNRVKKGEFNLICVKDFHVIQGIISRSATASNACSHFLGVRFISVNDNYDSDKYIGTTADWMLSCGTLSTPLTAKDLSVKTTTAKIQLMKQGKFVGGYAPYGMYCIQRSGTSSQSTRSGRSGEKDISAAISGNAPTEIAIRLNDEGIPTPGQYFMERHPDTKKYRRSSEQTELVSRHDTSDADQLVYTGCAVLHERRIVASAFSQDGKAGC